MIDYDTCSECGEDYPRPVEYNHSEEECLRNQAKRARS